MYEYEITIYILIQNADVVLNTIFIQQKKNDNEFKRCMEHRLQCITRLFVGVYTRNGFNVEGVHVH